MKYCQSCGNPLSDYADKCPKCGTKCSKTSKGNGCFTSLGICIAIVILIVFLINLTGDRESTSSTTPNNNSLSSTPTILKPTKTPSPTKTPYPLRDTCYKFYNDYRVLSTALDTEGNVYKENYLDDKNQCTAIIYNKDYHVGQITLMVNNEFEVAVVRVDMAYTLNGERSEMIIDWMATALGMMDSSMRPAKAYNTIWSLFESYDGVQSRYTQDNISAFLTYDDDNSQFTLVVLDTNKTDYLLENQEPVPNEATIDQPAEETITTNQNDDTNKNTSAQPSEQLESSCKGYFNSSRDIFSKYDVDSVLEEEQYLTDERLCAATISNQNYTGMLLLMPDDNYDIPMIRVDMNSVKKSDISKTLLNWMAAGINIIDTTLNKDDSYNILQTVFKYNSYISPNITAFLYYYEDSNRYSLVIMDPNKLGYDMNF